MFKGLKKGTIREGEGVLTFVDAFDGFTQVCVANELDTEGDLDIAIWFQDTDYCDASLSRDQVARLVEHLRGLLG